MNPVVETTAGRVEGRLADGVYSFLGVRYGADTATTRFEAPRAPAPWAGVSDASAYGASCFPTLTADERRYFPTSPLWRSYAGVGAAPFSEDCLFLNVWTSQINGAADRPVIVWFHGGGFSWGSGSSELSAGDGLAGRGDAVVVTFNHRLGILGFLPVPVDDAADRYADARVAGLLDCLLALDWVRRNIASFGGDPDNVTIAGHSGGGSKIAGLLAMPVARGLFRRAIVQSGVVLARSIEPDTAAGTWREVVSRIGSPADAVADLANRTPTELVEIGSGRQFRPVVGNRWLPTHPFDPVASESSLDIPLLIGTTKDDAAAFKFDADPAFVTLDREGLVERVAHHPKIGLGPRAAEVIDFFATKYRGASPAQLLMLISTAKLREHSNTVVERRLAASQTPIFLYLFAYEIAMPADTAFPGQLMSPHGVDMPFSFNIAGRTPLAGSRPDRTRLATTMSDHWVAFAANGDPAVDGAVAWPAFDVTRRRHMLFDSVPAVVDDPYGDERELLAAGEPVTAPLVGA